MKMIEQDLDLPFENEVPPEYDTFRVLIEFSTDSRLQVIQFRVKESSVPVVGRKFRKQFINRHGQSVVAPPNK